MQTTKLYLLCDGAVLLVTAARQNAALASVDTGNADSVHFVLETDASESAQETSHIGPLVQTVLGKTNKYGTQQSVGKLLS